MGKNESRTYWTTDGKIVDPWDKEGYVYSSCDFSLDYLGSKRWDILEIAIRRMLEDFNSNPSHQNARPEGVRVFDEDGRLEIHFRGKLPGPTHDCNGEENSKRNKGEIL